MKEKQTINQIGVKEFTQVYACKYHLYHLYSGWISYLILVYF